MVKREERKVVAHPKVSVLVLTYNGGKWLARCLRSLRNTDYLNLEVIIFDNGSSDTHAAEAMREVAGDERFHLMQIPVNQGYAGGNNEAFKRSTGDIVVFLNNDTEVSPDWVPHLVEVFLEHPDAGAVQCKQMLLSNRTMVDTLGGEIDPLGYGHSVAFVPDRPEFSQVQDIFYADGAAFAVSRKAVLEVLLDGEVFDADYFMYYEETDLAWRLRLHGYRILLAPKAVIYHSRFSANLAKTEASRIYTHARNRMTTLLKCYSVRNLVRYLPQLVLMETLRGSVLLFRRPDQTVAIFRALWYNARHLPRILSKRRQVQAMRRIDDREILRHMHRTSLLHLIGAYRRYYRGHDLGTTRG